MEKEEIIKEIDRLLKYINIKIKFNYNYGLCNFTHDEFRYYMSKRAKEHGLDGDRKHYWWHGRLRQENMNSSEWYAHLIKFLEDWKKELLDDVS